LQDALRLQRFAVRAVELLFKYRGGVVCGKAIQSLSGIECGPCRLPLQTITGDEIDSLKKELEAIDFFRSIQNPVDILINRSK
jgi:N-acetylneuraminate lyase